MSDGDELRPGDSGKADWFSNVLTEDGYGLYKMEVDGAFRHRREIQDVSAVFLFAREEGVDGAGYFQAKTRGFVAELHFGHGSRAEFQPGSMSIEARPDESTGYTERGYGTNAGRFFFLIDAPVRSVVGGEDTILDAPLYGTFNLFVACETESEPGATGDLALEGCVLGDQTPGIHYGGGSIPDYHLHARGRPVSVERIDLD